MRISTSWLLLSSVSTGFISKPGLVIELFLRVKVSNMMTCVNTFLDER